MTIRTVQSKKKVIRYGAVAAVLILALLGMGTYAWFNGNKTALNPFEGFFNNGARLHDDFGGEINKKNNDKDVYVENYGDAPLLIRVRLSEYYELGGAVLLGGQKNDVTTWEIHRQGLVNAASATWKWMMGGQKWYLPTDNLDDVDDQTGLPTGPGYANADNIIGRDWFGSLSGTDLETKSYASMNLTPLGRGTAVDSFTAADAGVNFTDNVFEQKGVSPAVYDQKTVRQSLNGTVTTMAKWKAAGSPADPVWVEDTDGWYYWAKQLEPDTATGLLLSGVDRLIDLEHDYYYGIHITLQAASRNELLKFGEDGNTISEDGKTVMNGAAKSPDVVGSHGIGLTGMNETYSVPRFTMLDYDITFDFQLPAGTSGTLNTAKWTILGKPTGGFGANSIRNADGNGTTDDAAQILLRVPRGSETSDITLRAASLDDPDFYIDFNVKAIDYVNQAGGGGNGGGGTALGGYADGMVGTDAPMNTDDFHTSFDVNEFTKGWYAVMLRGGDGGSASTTGGAGGWIKSILWLEPGQYTLVAGGIGSTSGVVAESGTTAYVGGGHSNRSSSRPGGGGGGFSGLFLTDSANYIRSNALAVAGGGGGAANYNVNGGQNHCGGGGGGGSGGNGVTALGVTGGSDGNGTSVRHQNGAGGGTGGGAPGIGSDAGASGYDGNWGAFFKGGDVTRSGQNSDRAGAGGSGWYGGGSGSGARDGEAYTAGGGGGGSSYVISSSAGYASGLIYTNVGGHGTISANLRANLEKLMPAPYTHNGRTAGVAAVCYMGQAYPDATLYP